MTDVVVNDQEASGWQFDVTSLSLCGALRGGGV